jgi:toxin lethal factor
MAMISTNNASDFKKFSPSFSRLESGPQEHIPYPRQRDTFTGSLSQEDQQQSRFLAASLTKPAGSGNQEDATLVRRELAKMPASQLRLLRDNGVQVLVGRNSVTDVAPELAKIQPRGHGEDGSYRNLPGVFSLERNAVIIAVEGHGTEGGPRIGESHGSENLVLHEALHAVEKYTPKHFKNESDFQQAYTESLPSLPQYERQSGEAGLSEGFAESGARFLTGADQSENLQAFWQTNANPHYEGKAEALYRSLKSAEAPSVLTSYLSQQTY